MSDKPQRRQLQFATLDDAVRDAENLLAKGYEKAGTWDLAQVAGHVANWMSYPLDGYPRTPLPIRLMLGMARLVAGRRLFERTVRQGFKAGSPTVPESVPAVGGDAAAAVARLRGTAGRLKAHTGPFHPSPLYGHLSKEDWISLNLVHAAHHLSFLVPRNG